MRAPPLLLALSLAVPGLAGAAAPPPEVKGAALTLYSQDLGLVRETRRVEPPSGAGVVTLAGLAPRLDASSIRVTPAGGWSVRGWSWRDPSVSWLETARGRKVRVLEVGERAVEGVLVGADDGGLVLARSEPAATIVVARSQVKEVEFAGEAAGVSAAPVLEVRAEGRGGRGEAELSYLTGGLSWQAEHVVVQTGERSAEWSATAALANQSGAHFTDARIQLVAGDPHRAFGRPVPENIMMMQARAMEAAEAEPKREALGEYYLYSVEGPHDLRNGETRGVVLLAPRAVKTEPRYLYNGQRLQGVRTQLEVENKKESGLGAPLAGGRVRFYQRNAAGDLVFTGEDRLGHTAVDEKRTLDVGVAFDLVGERKVLADRRLSDREREQTVEVKLRNRKAQPVTIVVEETLHGDVEIVRRSHEFTRKDANTIEFRIPVPAGQEVRVEYAARMRW